MLRHVMWAVTPLICLLFVVIRYTADVLWVDHNSSKCPVSWHYITLQYLVLQPLWTHIVQLRLSAATHDSGVIDDPEIPTPMSAHLPVALSQPAQGCDGSPQCRVYLGQGCIHWFWCCSNHWCGYSTTCLTYVRTP